MRKLNFLTILITALLVSGNVIGGNVAKIGSTEYATLAEAIANVPTSGVETEVMLIDNTTEHISIAAGKNVKLNLASFKFSGDGVLIGGTSRHMPIKLSGKLTITADSLNGEWLGGIESADQGSQNIVKFDGNDGDLTINGGYFTSPNQTYAYMFNFNSCPGKITINDGNFTGSGLCDYGTIINVKESSPKVDVTIHGGYFSVTPTTTNCPAGMQALIYTNSNTGTLHIDGGYFKVEKESISNLYSYLSIGCIIATQGTIEIEGGTYINETSINPNYPANFPRCGIRISGTTTNVNITGGKFSGPYYGAYIYGTSTINGGISEAVFEGGESGLLLSYFGSTDNHAVINGGEYKGGTNGIKITGASSKPNYVDIKSCIATGSRGLYMCADGAIVNVTGGTFNGDDAIMMYGEGSTLSLGGTVQCNGATNSAVKVVQGDVNITGGYYTSAGQQTILNQAYYTPCNINISGSSTITNTNANGYAVDNQIYGSNIGQTTIAGGKFKSNGANVKNDGAATDVTVSGGIFSQAEKNDIFNGPKTIPSGMDVVANMDASTKTEYPWMVDVYEPVPTSPSVEVGATNKWSLNTTWSSGIPSLINKVKINRNIEVDASASVKAEAYQIEVDADMILTVKTGASLNVGNGGLSAATGSKVLIEAGGKLTVGRQGITAGVENIELKADLVNGMGVLLFSPDAPVANTQVPASIDVYTSAYKISDTEYDWDYIGCPVKDMVSVTPKLNGTESGTINSYFQTWKNGWEDLTELSFVPFKGYATTSNTVNGITYTFKGNMLGNQNTPLKMDEGLDYYTFFANSYTAPININALIDGINNDAGINKTVYLFARDASGNKIVRTVSNNRFIPQFTAVIPALNGFFLRSGVAKPSDQNINYAEAIYNHQLPNKPILAPTRVADEETDFSRVRITITSAAGKTDYVYLIENEEGTSDFEDGIDEMKFMNQGLNIYAKTTAGKQSALFDADLIGANIGVQANSTESSYTLTFDELLGETFTLKDNVTSQTIDMEAGASYQFSITAGSEAETRFTITTKTTPTALKQTTMGGSVKKVMVNDQLIILREGKTYNAQGQEL